MSRRLLPRTRWPKKLRPPKPFPDISHLLHHLRGREFARLPKGIRRLVSVGCAGTWYFDWIEQTCGPIPHHVGVEFYMPRPETLPENVTWIANTAGSMPEVADASADAIFSGENLEHLWPEEVTGFLLESHRILEHNGLLVIDSPNRAITSRLNWSHPEHTVELTVPEIVRLVELSGFDVTRCAGLWLCEDLQTGSLLRFDAMDRFGRNSLSRRSRKAERHPEKSFIWWIEARKTARKPQVELVREEMARIFAEAWPERCRRVQSLVGRREGDWIAADGRGGMLMYGPYMAIRGGRYRATFDLACDPASPASAGHVASCDILSGASDTPLAAAEIVGPSHDGSGRFRVRLPFTVEGTTFGIQFRVVVPEGVPLKVAAGVGIEPLDAAADMTVAPAVTRNAAPPDVTHDRAIAEAFTTAYGRPIAGEELQRLREIVAEMPRVDRRRVFRAAIAAFDHQHHVTPFRVRLADDDVRFAEIDGVAVATDPTDLAVGVPLGHGGYERHLRNFWAGRLGPGMTFLDVGANIGGFTMLAAKLVGPQGSVFAYEPNAENCRLIQLGGDRNGFTNIRLQPVGLGDSNGAAIFTTAIGSNGRLLLEGLNPTGADGSVIPLRRLDDEPIAGPIHGIKIDVEGCEGLVVAGAAATIDRWRPVVTVEFSPHMLRQIGGTTPESLLGFFTSRDYRVFRIVPDAAESLEPVEDVESFAARSIAEGSLHDMAFIPREAA